VCGAWCVRVRRPVYGRRARSTTMTPNCALFVNVARAVVCAIQYVTRRTAAIRCYEVCVRCHALSLTSDALTIVTLRLTHMLLRYADTDAIQYGATNCYAIQPCARQRGLRYASTVAAIRAMLLPQPPQRSITQPLSRVVHDESFVVYTICVNATAALMVMSMIPRSRGRVGNRTVAGGGR